MDQLLSKLQSNKASERKSAAKSLRKTINPAAFSTLKTALLNEINSTSWEAQYHMIMALGQIPTRECLDFLYSFNHDLIEYGMVSMALADSITRIEIILESFNGVSPEFLMDEMYFDGIMRAIAILQYVPKDDFINIAIAHAISSPPSSNTKKWVAAASAGWTGCKKSQFLEHCLNEQNQQTVRAAEAAIRGKYLKWSIL